MEKALAAERVSLRSPRFRQTLISNMDAEKELGKDTFANMPDDDVTLVIQQVHSASAVVYACRLAELSHQETVFYMAVYLSRKQQNLLPVYPRQTLELLGSNVIKETSEEMTNKPSAQVP